MSMQQPPTSSSSTIRRSAALSIPPRNGHCAKCNHPFGKIGNKFEKVTGSYYQYLDDYAISRIDLNPDGATKELGPKNQVLQGCTVQALACNSCGDRFAFQCVSTPNDKVSFKHRLFFKLDHINIVDKDTGTDEQPLILSGLTLPAHVTTGSPKHEDTLSPPPSAQSDMPSVDHPDYEAARGIMAKEPWSAVHEQWERRTHERLSPSTFGKRILPVVHEIQSAQKRDFRSHSRESSEVRPIANGRSIPQAKGFNQAENTRPRYPDSLESQRADINRIDAALASVQSEMGQLRGLMAQMRYEIQCEPRRSSIAGAEDAATIDSLAETVSRVASRTGELDGMRFELTTLKGKINRMQETQGIPSTPSQSVRKLPRSEPPVQPPPSRHQEIAPRGWNAVNTNKRKSMDGSPAFAEAKRPRTDYRATNGETAPSYAPHVAPAPPQPTLAPIRSTSQDSWQSDAQRLPSIRGMHHGPRGGSARPHSRIHPSQDYGTADWDRESWENSRVDDGYYRPLGGIPGTPLSPGAAKRGNLIRRGTSGGGAPLQYIDPGPTKRTRQRPVRNEQGILIRKDGKPDQRSISSPQNLRKVHERRMAEQEGRSQGSPEDPLSPADTDAPRSMADPNSVMGSSGSGSPAMDQQSPLEAPDSRPPSASNSRPTSKHDKVMHKMFPHGLVNGAQRMNHAAHIFDHNSHEHHRAELRRDMERREARDYEQAYRGRMEIDETQYERTRDEEEEEKPNGVAYEPSQSQTQQDESKRDVVPDSVDPSNAIEGKGNDSVVQESDNRPLRVRELAEPTAEQQASGSVYEPSPEETSTA